MVSLTLEVKSRLKKNYIELISQSYVVTERESISWGGLVTDVDLLRTLGGCTDLDF